MTKALKVEPGSKASVTARSRKASPSEPLGELGLKRGQLASERISPVRGSSTTAMPAVALASTTAFSSARSVAYCSVESMVSVRLAPLLLCVSSTPLVKSLRPLASRKPSRRTLSPVSSCSKLSSRPSRPWLSVPTSPMTWAASSRCG